MPYTENKEIRDGGRDNVPRLYNMKIMKKTLIIAVSVVALLGACSKTNKAAEEEAEIRAAMMEGRNTGRMFVNRSWKDTTELREKLQDTRSSKKAEYDSLGKQKYYAAFDSAFVSTIRTVNHKIASQLQ